MRPRAVLLAAAWVLLSGASYTAHREVEAGNDALAAGDPKGAIGHYERAGKADPKAPAIPYDLGTARLAAGDVDGAVEALGAAAGEPEAQAPGVPDPVQARAAFNLGNALLARANGPNAKADLQAAVQAYRRAVAADPTDPAARRNLQIAATRLRDLPPPQSQPQPQPKQQQNRPDPSQQGGQQSPSQGNTGQQAQPQQDAGKPSQGDQKATPAPPEKGGKSGAPQDEANAEANAQAHAQAHAHDQDRPGRDASVGGAQADKGEVPEDVARALAALRRKEAAVMREALRRGMGKPEAVEPDW
jgi:tetratricopeptide (TPR) repeat protein